MNKREHFHTSVYDALQAITGLTVRNTYTENANPERPFAVVSLDPAQMQPEYYENAELVQKRGQCFVSVRLMLRTAAVDVDDAGLLRQEYNRLLHEVELALDGLTIEAVKFGTMVIEDAVCAVISEAPLFDDAEQEGEAHIIARIDFVQRYEA